MSKKIFSSIMILSIFFYLFRSQTNMDAKAQDSPSFIRMVRSIAVDETGVSNPVGIGFSLQSNNFYVAGANAQGNPLPAYLDIIQLNRFVERSGSARIMAAVEDPMDLAFDNKAGRLLSYQTKTNKLIEVKQDSEGNLDPASLIRHDVRRLGVQDPQGMSVDGTSGDVFILDKVGPRIVQIELGAGGSFANAPISVVDLRAVGTSDLRGLAIDPSTGHFFVLSPNQQRLYELTRAGQIETVRDLSEFGLINPQGMVFAPSGDQTDDPTITSLFLADSGTLAASESINTSSSQASVIETQGVKGVKDIRSSGQILELSLNQLEAPAMPSFSSTVVKVTDMATPPFSPPSPDPLGLAYIPSSNNLLMSDGEVEEIVDGITHFQGANVWEMNLDGSVVITANISSVPPTLVSFTDEPTGIAWNPSDNGHFYFTDDDANKVFDLSPGNDGDFWTADDSWTSFDVLLGGIGSNDAEGIAYDGVNLFVADGVNAEIYKFDLEGNYLGQFDVQQYGVVNPNSVEYNEVNKTLLIMSNQTDDVIIETDLDGALLRTIDISALNARSPDGLAFAPASDGSPTNRFYILDSGIGNNTDPNIIDGKMFEATAPPPISEGNQPPIVDAGSDINITLPTNSVDLVGTILEEDPPIPEPASTTWSKASGPCQVIFGNANNLVTTATFSYAGRYILRLEANDGELNSQDTLTTIVQRPSPSKIFDAIVEDTTDDAEESVAGVMTIAGTKIELGERDGSAQIVGFRFNWLGIPQGATIISTYIQFKANQDSSGLASLYIKGQDIDDAPTFSGPGDNISSRVTTTASVPWNPPAWIKDQQGDDQKTPNIASVVQEIVDRPGWVSGNSMAFIIDGTGTRIAQAYDGDDPCGAAKLHIEYNVPPVAVNNTYTTDAGEVLNVAAPGVLGNDSDADSDSLEAVKVTNPSNGILVLNKSGSFSYTPNEGFVGTDSFTYNANDGTVNSNTAMVTITVTPLPTVDLIKDVTPTSRLEPGGVFTYTLTITNTSDEQVKIISLTDTYKLPKACKDLVNQWIPASGNLSCSYEITHTDVGSYSNTAEVTVEDNEANSASDTANTEVTVREKPRLYLPLITR